MANGKFDMASSGRNNFEKALLDPKSAYRTPESVLADLTLDREGKRAILESWKQDARQLSVAEGEAMTGGEPNMLHRVLLALERVAPKPSPSSQGRATVGSGKEGSSSQ